MKSKRPDIYSSFRVGVPSQRLNELKDPENWPIGAYIANIEPILKQFIANIVPMSCATWDKEEISEKPNATAINEATNDENPADTPASAIGTRRKFLKNPMLPLLMRQLMMKILLTLLLVLTQCYRY
ncbi:hypothetical protein QE152_g40550 [Popillia japonica]|uniref:Uncharacterized protein n=1 Tax=Popillia japonica TaxID=7064 RepID=A0AAW1HGA3_POPJA